MDGNIYLRLQLPKFKIKKIKKLVNQRNRLSNIMENQQQPVLTVFDEEETHTGPAQQTETISMSNLSKSANNLPPAASRVSRIKTAVMMGGNNSQANSSSQHHLKQPASGHHDDDLERASSAVDSKIMINNQAAGFQQRSTLSRGSSQNPIDQECEKLKESYSQHRRQRNSQSRERSKSGMRGGANSRSIGRRALNAAAGGGAGENGINLDKENAEDGGLRNSATSSTFQNRYKRNQSNNKSLQNYQEKYNKLEENFKKFTQGLQDKRNTSASGRFAFQTINQGSSMVTTANNNGLASSAYAPAAAPQPHQNQSSSFGPIRSEVSPVRGAQRTSNHLNTKSPFQAAQLDISNQFNPVVGLSQTGVTQQHHAPQLGVVRNSHQNIDKSLHLESLLGAANGAVAANLGTIQHSNFVQSAIYDNTVAEGASRLQMLNNLVTRMNHFVETCFNKLVSLCISKQQEKQLQDLQLRVKALVHQTTLSVQKITSEDGPELAEESQKVQEIYRQCVENLQNCFQEILHRIYQVESETFKNYKFKDTMGALELILQESHRLNLYQLLPQLIDNLKLRKVQAAAGMLQSQLTKRKLMLEKQSFITWRSKAGLNQFLTRTFRHASLSKAVHRLVRNWSQRNAGRYFNLWRQILFNRKQEIQANSQGGSIVENLLLDPVKFNDCLQEDASLALLLATQVKDMLGDFCDFQFIGHEDVDGSGAGGSESALADESQNLATSPRAPGAGGYVEVITGFDFESGQPRVVYTRAIENTSITGLSLKRTPRSEGQIKLTECIFANSLFNEQIDAPLLPRSFLQSKAFQDLEMLALPLYDQNMQLLGLMRVFSPNRINEEMQCVYTRASTIIGSFCGRMQLLRANFGALHRDIQVKGEQIELHSLESCVHSCLFDILDGLQEGTRSEFAEMLETRSNKMLNSLLPGLRLRQIYHKVRDQKDKFVLQKIVRRAILGDDEVSGRHCLVRQRDHKSEKEQLLEDFLDYQQDRITHQISVDSEGFNFIFHRDLPKGDFFVKETLNENLKFAVTLFTQCLQPVLLQGLKIHEELALKVKGQARELVRQVSINTSTEMLRDLISKIPGLGEQQAYEQFELAIRTCLNQSDLMGQAAQVTLFTVMINSGVLSGQPLAQAQMIAYLTPEQNQFLQMPERLDIQFSPTEAEHQVARYQAAVSEYSQVRQEMQIRDQQSISVVLPICSEKNLLALIKLEIALNEEDTDKQSTVQDIKALIAAIQLQCQKALTQIVFGQANQNFHFKECFEQLQAQISNLTIDLDFSQALQEHLVLPFTQAPSAKTMGVALTRLAKRVLPQLELTAISLCLDGREAIRDIRLLDWKYIMEDDAEGTRALENQGVPAVAFNIQDRTICVSIEGDCERRGLIMRFNLSPELINEAKEEAHDFILQQCQVFQLIVTPFIQSAMSSLSMTALIPPKQEQLPRVLTKIVMQRKYGYIYNFFMRLKELQVNKVPIFTRLASYRHIVRTKYESWGIEQTIGYGQEAKREYLVRERVLNAYAKTFKALNGHAFRVKESYFSHLKNQVLAHLANEQATLQYRAAYQPTKLQRKALGLIYKCSKQITLRAFFVRLAVRTNKFSRLNNPKCRDIGAALCVFVNYLKIRQRKAFQRLRANAAQVYFRDFAGAEIRDRERMLRLSRVLYETNLNVQDSSRHLEEAIMNVMEQALTYLQKEMCQEQLDLIVCTIQQTNARKARAYTFQNKVSPNQRKTQEIQRVSESEVIDGVTSANIDMLVGEHGFSSNQNNISDFNLSFKRDIILQMLSKGQTAFNFNNISQSLYDLYLNHLGRGAQNNQKLGEMGPGSALAGQSTDPEMVKRMMIVKRSKSSLILPLLIPFRPAGGIQEEDEAFYNTGMRVPEFRLIGSLELYKYHFQPFDEELERRLGIFAKIFANDCLPIYFSLRQTQLQIDSLRRQVQRNTKPVTNLTGLLRQVYFNAPTQLNASLVLPIIIDQKTRIASFFQFKDNHIYNFAYQNTFIGELVDMACILELASSTDPSDQQQKQTANDNGEDTDATLSDRESIYSENNFGGAATNSQSIISQLNSQTDHRRKSVDPNQVRSITNEKFQHILYYPIVSGALRKTKAVIEVCYNDMRKVPKHVITNQIQSFLETFGGQLNQLESRLRTFCKFTESSIARRDGIQKTKFFQRWKASIQFEAQRREFVQNQKQTINQTEQCFSEYVKSLECYDNELKKIVQEREELKENLAGVNLDRTAKYKFLGASLIILNNMERIQKRTMAKEAFNTWRFSQSVGKIAEKAFNKILELNHRHSNQRFESACFLLTKSVGKIIKKDAIERISQYATMSQLRHHRQRNYAGSSFVTSLELSPNRPNAAAFNYESRKSGDKLSNIVRVGLQSNSKSTSLMMNPPPSVPQHNSVNLVSASYQQVSQNAQKPSGFTSFMTPNTNTSRTYDIQMQSYGVQMGFGAVPSRVNHNTANVTQGSRKNRSKSRSASQRRSLIQK